MGISIINIAKIVRCSNCSFHIVASNLNSNRPLIVELKKSSVNPESKKIAWKNFFKVSSLLFLTFPVATFGLGCWQWKRLQWKNSLIFQIDERQNELAIEFPPNGPLEDFEYRKVHLKGTYLYDKQFVIRHRPRFDKAFKGISAGIISSGADISSHGSHVITPFQLHNSKDVIMVNRGWIPSEKVPIELSCTDRKSDLVDIEAIVRKSDKRPLFVPENVPQQGMWFYKDLRAMGEYCGAQPIFLDAVYESSQPGGPIGGQTNVTLRNEHWNYMMFWYALSALSFGMWCFHFI